MKWDNKGLKTYNARVSGLGSAKSGTGHWINQRLTAIANVPLVLWLIWSVTQNDFSDYTLFTLWIAQPVNAVLVILFILSAFYHAVLGTQVVVEDYVHHEGLKISKLVAHRLIFTALAVACLFSVLKLAFGG